MNRKKGNILVVDDNEEILWSLNQLLKKEFNKVYRLKGPNQILSLLQKYQVDVVLLDMNFTAGLNTGNEGFYWFNEIKKLEPNIVIIFMTAYGDIDIAVRAMKEGADDFVTKPWDSDKLINSLHNFVKLSQAKRKVNQLKAIQSGFEETYDSMLGKSEAMLHVRSTIQKIASTDATVIVQGENGTGKTLIAYEIHKKSLRSGEPFIHVDLGAINENLFESELFGHVKGAFTDAKDDRIGRFEVASEGTLFLDEIGNLSLALQQKMLNVLQTKTISKVGSNKVEKVDVRLICATNRNLRELVAKGEFREDLYYRINTIIIESPPLRERYKDILFLANTFLTELSIKYNKTNMALSDTTIQKLDQYSWPGNVRELKHAIERAVLLSTDKKIKPEDLFPSGISNKSNKVSGKKLDDIEKDAILNAINNQKGNITKAANELGI